MNAIAIIAEHIGADPNATQEELTEALERADEEQVMAALQAVIVAQATTPKAAGRR